MTSRRRWRWGAQTLLTRRKLQIALGVLWLFDGALQFQPSMFTPTFYGMMLRMGPAEAPSWLWDIQTHLEPWITSHSPIANSLFASLQVLIGLGIIWRRSARAALMISIVWGLGVWLIGESAGGLFSPGASALTGAPGAALVYAVVALVLLLRREDDFSTDSSLDYRTSLLDLTWVALWLGTAALEAESVNLMPLVASGAIYNAGNGEPAWFSAINHAVGNLVGGHGVLFAGCTGIAQAAIGLGILARRLRALSLVVGMLVALFYGIVGQDLGGIFSNGIGVLGSNATDPGTSLIIVLLALTLWIPKIRLATPATSAAVREVTHNNTSRASSPLPRAAGMRTPLVAANLDLAAGTVPNGAFPTRSSA